jgi:hypothetical protein
MSPEEQAEELLLENLQPGEKVMLFGSGQFNCGLTRGQLYGSLLLIAVFLLLAASSMYLDVVRYWPFIVCFGLVVLCFKIMRSVPVPASKAPFYAVTNNRLLAIDLDKVTTLSDRKHLSKIGAKEKKVTVIWKNQRLVIEPIRRRIG